MKRVFAVLAAAVLIAGTASAQELSNFNFGGRQQVVSPEIADGQVTFRLAADYATVVTLSGNWIQGTIPMKKENGVWSVTIDLPEPEI